MRKYVLDANAILTLLQARRGAQRIKKLIYQAERSDTPFYVSAVNWGEVVYALWQSEGEGTVRTFLNQASLPSLVIAPADRERAALAAELKAKHGMAYADCFAAALSIELNATLITADPEFKKIGKKLKIDFLPRHEGSASK